MTVAAGIPGSSNGPAPAAAATAAAVEATTNAAAAARVAVTGRERMSGGRSASVERIVGRVIGGVLRATIC